MSIAITQRSIDVLTGALLGPVKGYLRVGFCDDDAQLQDLIAAVIEIIEAQDDCAIFSTTYLWKPGSSEFSGSAANVPVSPVTSWTATADPAATNVTANYSLVTDGVFGVKQYSLLGVWVAGLAFTIQSGFTADTLPAQKRIDICRGVSTIYEYREVLTPSNLVEMPGWLNDRICGNWRPRV